MSKVQCERDTTLIVDDDAVLVRLFHSILSAELPSLKIDAATDGVEAVQSFGMHHHAVVLMDIHLPVMNGEIAFHEIEALCSRRSWCMPSVLFCTAYAPRGALSSIYTRGSSHGLLLKPLAPASIVDAVRCRLELGHA